MRCFVWNISNSSSTSTCWSASSRWETALSASFKRVSLRDCRWAEGSREGNVMSCFVTRKEYFKVWTLNEVSRARWTKYLAASFCLYLLSESHRFCNRVQDSYTLRCCPQVRDFANNCTGKATIKKLCQNTLIKQTGHSLFALSLDKQLKIDPNLNSILLCELIDSC